MLTGNIRYRVAGWFRRRLVLQVQVRLWEQHGAIGIWRDATVEDITRMEVPHAVLSGS